LGEKKKGEAVGLYLGGGILGAAIRLPMHPRATPLGDLHPSCPPHAMRLQLRAHTKVSRQAAANHLPLGGREKSIPPPGRIQLSSQDCARVLRGVRRSCWRLKAWSGMGSGAGRRLLLVTSHPEYWMHVFLFLVKKVYRGPIMEEGMLGRSISTSAVECIAIILQLQWEIHQRGAYPQSQS